MEDVELGLAAPVCLVLFDRERERVGGPAIEEVGRRVPDDLGRLTAQQLGHTAVHERRLRVRVNQPHTLVRALHMRR